MSLFKTIQPILAAGAVLQMKVSAVAGDKIQLDLIPIIDTKATGIMIPSQSFTATADELDNELGQHLAGLVSGTASLSNQVAVAAAIMEDAKAKADQAVKNAATAPVKSASTRTTTSTPARGAKAMNAGLDLDDDDEGGQTVVGAGAPETPVPATAGSKGPAEDGVIELF